MKIINDGLPELIFEWLQQDFYDTDAVKDSISATSLIKPSQEIILTQRYYDQIELKASDRVWSLFGSGIHAVLEKLDGEKEVRLFWEYEGQKISGKFDRVKDNTLIDYKVTSAWTLVFKSRLDEWKKQLSIYRFLYYKTNGVLLDDNAHIIAILRDWDKKRLGNGYPEKPIVEITLPLISVESTEKNIIKKLKSIKEQSLLSDDKLKECTDSQRWWNSKTKNYCKCSKYCLVSKFCKQNQKRELEMKKSQKKDFKKVANLLTAICKDNGVKEPKNLEKLKETLKGS